MSTTTASTIGTSSPLTSVPEAGPRLSCRCTDSALMPVKCMPLTAMPMTSAEAAMASPRRTVIASQSATVAATIAMTTDSVTRSGS